MELKRIQYSQLNSKQKEIYNFQKISGELADFGFNCIKLADDWQGADFLAYHVNGEQTLKVQLKSRLTIDKKYLGKNIFIGFPVLENWYMIEHDDLVKIIKKSSNWLESNSWIVGGGYSSIKPNKDILRNIEPYKL